MRSFQLIIAAFFTLATLGCSEKETLLADQLIDKADSTDRHMYVIERSIPGAGDLSSEDLKAISKSSCDVIESIGSTDIEWLHSYITGDKVYCVYMATDEGLIREHAEKGGFPANSVQEVATVIYPGTAVE